MTDYSKLSDEDFVAIMYRVVRHYPSKECREVEAEGKRRGFARIKAAHHRAFVVDESLKTEGEP